VKQVKEYLQEEGLLVRQFEEMSIVEVTVKYHLMTYTLFLAIVCLTIYFLLPIHYLLPTEWQYRPGGG